jgi:DNA polymerase-3 subunit gamma/tau
MPVTEPTTAAAAAASDIAHLQQAAVDALSAASSQSTAADAISDSEWTHTGSEILIQTDLSKMMLPTVVNPEAEKILRAAVLGLAPGMKLTLLPRSAAMAKSAAPKKPRAAASGSAQARALEHPLVQEAQRLFDAEIRNVIDLTSND